MPNNPRMLEGYRVLDFTQFVAGPTCSRLLGEMGAEVIKVELAPHGDRVRGGGLKPLAPEHKNTSHSSYYLQHNHSKLSFAIDIKKPGAHELIMSMIPKIDVVVENYAPGVIKRMGFSYEAFKKVNPKIIWRPIAPRRSPRWRLATFQPECPPRWQSASRCSIASAPARDSSSTPPSSIRISICTRRTCR